MSDCEWIRRGRLCPDDLCHSGGDTLCGYPVEEEEALADSLNNIEDEIGDGFEDELGYDFDEDEEY